MKRTNYALLITGLLFAMTAPAAHAGCCPQPDVVMAVNADTAATTNSIARHANVVEGTGKMIIQSQAENTKAINQQAAERAKNMELYRLGQQYQLPPDPCTLGAIATHAEAMNRAQGAISSSFQLPARRQPQSLAEP